MPAPQSPEAAPGAVYQARRYLSRQVASPGRYLLEQTMQALAVGVPSLAGIALRATLYRRMLRIGGSAAIERKVQLRFVSHIGLGRRRRQRKSGLLPARLSPR